MIVIFISAYVVSYVEFAFSLFATHLSFFVCVSGGGGCGSCCGIYWISSKAG